MTRLWLALHSPSGHVAIETVFGVMGVWALWSLYSTIRDIFRAAKR